MLTTRPPKPLFRALSANSNWQRRRPVSLYRKTTARTVAHSFYGVITKQYITSARISTFLDAVNFVKLTGAPMP